MEMAHSVEKTEAAGRVIGEDCAGKLRGLAALLDWDRIYFDLLDYKMTAELPNLTFTAAALREIVERGDLILYCAEQQLAPAQLHDLRGVEDVVVALLRKYLARLYDHERQQWEQQNLRLRDLGTDDDNVKFRHYAVMTKSALAKSVRELVQKADELYRKDLHVLPTIHFDRHLYQPLLAFDLHDHFKSTPRELNKGETQFVCDLRDFLQANPKEHEGKEVFLLRNLARGYGIGFFSPKEGEAFYPDFILWIIEDGRQTIAFVDPHGLGRARALVDPKIQLHHRLIDLRKMLQPYCPDWDIRLTSFIVSPTTFAKMQRTSWIAAYTREQLEAEHILFQESPATYVTELWKGLRTA
jgi:hypothetical protein